MRPLVARPGDGHTIEGPVGGPLTFKARAEETEGRLSAFENEVAPGQGPPQHRHESEDEAWVVLEGSLRFRIDGEESDAPAGTFVWVPRGTDHCFVNPGDEPARILVMFSPGGMEGFFHAFAALPEDADIPSAFRELGAQHGMTVTGPPMSSPPG